MIQFVEARCLGQTYASRQRKEICDVFGCLVGEITIVPTVYIQDKITEIRTAPSLLLSERYTRLKNAAQLYEHATIAGLDPSAFIELVSSVTGLHRSIVADSLIKIARHLEYMKDIIQEAVPKGAVLESNVPLAAKGCSLFSRRGDIVSIIAAGNGPGVHGLWPQAIAMGYRTLVRPSLREPFTAQRLVSALEMAGLSDYVAFMPTDHKGAEALISQSDLAIVYGGSEVAARYRDNPRVLVQGPGRSKIMIGKDIPHEEAVGIVAQSVLSLGGAACVSASAILVEDNPHEFAKKLRCELEIRVQQQFTRLGGFEEVAAYEKLLEHDEVPWVVAKAKRDAYHLTPYVTVVESASDYRVQRELPFPCVTVAPFNRSNESYQALSNSLVVTVLSHDDELINKILSDGTISNVYIGKIPTTWMDYHVPHDGYLADFLMRNRGFRIDVGWGEASILG